jgi:hypothetical protein
VSLTRDIIEPGMCPSVHNVRETWISLSLDIFDEGVSLEQGGEFSAKSRLSKFSRNEFRSFAK